jgi:TonB family protein
MNRYYAETLCRDRYNGLTIARSCAMTEDWKQWEGQVIADAFPLRQCLGGDGDHAVFLTEYGQPASEKAAIRIQLGTAEDGELQIQRWSRASKLSHPHLLRILTLGRWQVSGAPLVYMLMEYADESLAQVIPVRPLSAEEARQTIEPALEVLAYVHAQGFVHGHIQPGNIMAVGDCLKISIAGLCRAGECPPAIADAYTPPERTASAAGDVWSFGLTLVEMLTQHLPVHTSDQVVVPETLPQPFLEIAQRCLRPDPKDRPAFSDIAAGLQPTINPTKRPALKWTYALAALAGLILAAVVIAPKLIDRQAPIAIAEPVQIPAARPAQPTPTVPAAPPQAPARDEIVQRVLPEVPAAAARTILGRVKVSVRVRVDSAGHVAEAKLDSAGPSKYFGQLALQAARRWKFAPANGDEPARPREWILHFEFSRTGTRAVSARRAS